MEKLLQSTFKPIIYIVMPSLSITDSNKTHIKETSDSMESFHALTDLIMTTKQTNGPVLFLFINMEIET